MPLSYFPISLSLSLAVLSVCQSFDLLPVNLRLDRLSHAVNERPDFVVTARVNVEGQVPADALVREVRQGMGEMALEVILKEEFSLNAWRQVD